MIAVENEQSEMTLILKNPVTMIPLNSSRASLAAHVVDLRERLKECEVGLTKSYAKERLMDDENHRLRVELFEKKQTKMSKKGRKGDGHTRHMTSEEQLQLLGEADWRRNIEAVHKEVSERFKAIREAYQHGLKALEDKRKAEQAEEKKKRAAEVAKEKMDAAAAKKAESEERKKSEVIAKEAAKAAKKAESEEKRRAAADEKGRKAEAVAMEKARKAEIALKEKEDLWMRKQQVKEHRQAEKRARDAEKTPPVPRLSRKRKADDGNFNEGLSKRAKLEEMETVAPQDPVASSTTIRPLAHHLSLQEDSPNANIDPVLVALSQKL